MKSILQLFKVFGAIAAVVLCVGFVASTDNDLLKAYGVDRLEEVNFATVDNSNPFSSLQRNVRIANYNDNEHVVRNRPTSEPLAVLHRPTNNDHHKTPKAASKTRKLSAQQIENWIQLNVAQTYLEAEKETVSPGVILATGVYFLQQGSGDETMNAADIVNYLKDVRKNASKDAKACMRYIANSNEWFKGLKLAGFDGDKIAKIFASHELAAYDKQMYARHIERKIERGTSSTKDADLAADEATRTKNLATAYNDYANRSDIRKKHALPAFKAPKPMAKEEVSKGRAEALSFKAGETRTYKDARFFFAVVQEMIALEQGFDNWEAYKKAQPQAASKAFQARSNIMAMGGRMQVSKK